MRKLCFVLCLLVIACGRPATEAECEEIVARIAELELRDAPSVPSARVAEEVQATQRAFQGEIMKQCVGKRITEDALGCVRVARSAQQIVEQCFN